MLVVDYFVQPVGLLCKMLSRLGLEDIRQVHNPYAARRHCGDCNFDMVCSDSDMGEDKSGMRLLQALHYS